MTSSFDYLQPQDWAEGGDPPDFVFHRTIGAAVDWILRVLEFRGQWHRQRRDLVEKQLRWFAQLYVEPGSSVYVGLLDAAYHLRQGSLDDGLAAGYTAALEYKALPQAERPQTVLDMAVRSGSIPLAQAARGADIDLADFNGTTPLMRAAHAQHTDMVAWLLANGADPHATDVFGDTYRHYAAGCA